MGYTRRRHTKWDTYTKWDAHTEWRVGYTRRETHAKLDIQRIRNKKWDTRGRTYGVGHPRGLEDTHRVESRIRTEYYLSSGIHGVGYTEWVIRKGTFGGGHTDGHTHGVGYLHGGGHTEWDKYTKWDTRGGGYSRSRTYRVEHKRSGTLTK